MLGTGRSHLHHHWRFYAALTLGAIVFLALDGRPFFQRFIAAGDSFYIAYLVLAGIVIARISARQLCEQAALEDEGIFIVIVTVLAVIALSGIGILGALKQGHAVGAFQLVLSLASAPLGWFTLHAIAAFHYANLYYEPNDDGGPAGHARTLDFPECSEPGIWEFLYFSYVVGMTAQTSDVDVTGTKMRRATTGHAIVSFFFNTAIIAMAVNAAVSLAS